MNTRKSARLISKAQAALMNDRNNASFQDRMHYKVKFKRGHLKMMNEMPVDVQLEIFCLLEPVDLLHLSRASKSLRKLLLANNVLYIWKLVLGFTFSNLQKLQTL